MLKDTVKRGKKQYGIKVYCPKQDALPLKV